MIQKIIDYKNIEYINSIFLNKVLSVLIKLNFTNKISKVMKNEFLQV